MKFCTLVSNANRHHFFILTQQDWCKYLEWCVCFRMSGKHTLLTYSTYTVYIDVMRIHLPSSSLRLGSKAGFDMIWKFIKINLWFDPTVCSFHLVSSIMSQCFNPKHSHSPLVGAGVSVYTYFNKHWYRKIWSTLSQWEQ